MIPKFLLPEIHYAENVAFVADETLNTLAGGNPRITVSARCGSQIAAKKPCLLCRVICGFIERVLGLKGHCLGSWQIEAPIAYASRNMVGGRNDRST